MSFEEIDTEESTSSLSEVSSLDDDLDRMRLESESSVEEMWDDEMDLNSWNEIKSESDAEFMEEHGTRTKGRNFKKLSVLIVTNFFVLIVLTRSVMLCNK